MSESKIVYVNEEEGSDNEDENLIYGAAPTTQETYKQPIEQPIEQVIAPPAPVKPEEAEAEEPKAELEEPEKEPEQEPEQEPAAEQEIEKQEIEANDEEDEEDEEEHENVVGGGDEEGSMFGGGDGYRSEPDDASSVSSLDTDAILNVDPLYFRLTKFLQTGGSEPENVAEILKKINTNLELMNQNLMNLMNAKSTQ